MSEAVAIFNISNKRDAIVFSGVLGRAIEVGESPNLNADEVRRLEGLGYNFSRNQSAPEVKHEA